MPPVRSQPCRAHSSRSGLPCRNRALIGSTVCGAHGGKAPQVKHAAEQRIRDLVDPAITELERLVAMADSDTVRLAAVKDVLDRAGYGAKQVVQHEHVIRKEAERIAAEFGLPVEQVMREAGVQVAN